MVSYTILFYFIFRLEVYPTMQPQNPLGVQPIPTLLRRFAIPSIVAMVVSSLYNIVDQIFIGQGVGYLGNAATNVAYPLTTICLAISLLIGIGSASRFSLELGRGNRNEAAGCISNAFWMVVVCGIVYAILVELFLIPLLHLFGATPNIMDYAVSYVRITAVGMPFLIYTNVMSNLIRADGSPRFSMLCMVVGAVINTILDPIFIFQLDMGVAGAALATVISQFVSFLLALSYLGRFQQVSLNRQNFRFHLRQSLASISLGASNCITQLAITLVQIVINNSLSHYGAQSVYGSDIPLSAFGVVMKVNSLFLSVFIGLHQGSQPIIGFNYGAKQYDRVKAVYKLAVKCTFLASVPGLILFECFPQYVLALFGSGDALYMEFGVRAMGIFLSMIMLNGIQLLSSNFFAAIGKPLKGVILALSRQCFFIIPLALILPIFLGLDGILLSGPIADVLAFLISMYFIRKEFLSMGQLSASAEVVDPK